MGERSTRREILQLLGVGSALPIGMSASAWAKTERDMQDSADSTLAIEQPGLDQNVNTFNPLYGAEPVSDVCVVAVVNTATAQPPDDQPVTKQPASPFSIDTEQGGAWDLLVGFDAEDDTGGKVTVEFSGLPDGDWNLQNGEITDESDHTTTIEWEWEGSESAYGQFQDLYSNENFEISLDATFNDGIDEWEFWETLEDEEETNKIELDKGETLRIKNSPDEQDGETEVEKIRDKIEYGPVLRGETPTQPLTLYNPDDAKSSATVTEIATPADIEIEENCWFDWWCSELPPREIEPGEIASFELELDSEGFGIVESIDATVTVTVDGTILELPISGTVIAQPEYFRALAKTADNIAKSISPEVNQREAVRQAVDGLDSAYDVAKDNASKNLKNLLKDGKETIENYGDVIPQVNLAGALTKWHSIAGGKPHPETIIDQLNTIETSLRNCAEALEQNDSEEALEDYQQAKEVTRDLADIVADGNFFDLPQDFRENFRDSVRAFAIALLGEESRFVTANSPVDLEVIDPIGNVLSKETVQIDSGVYFEAETDADGTDEDWIMIPSGKPGGYTVDVVAEDDASPDETYSLGWVSDSRETIFAEDETIENIPDSGYEENRRRVLAGDLTFNPETLNTKSQGRFVTTYLQLPEGFGATQVTEDGVDFEISVEGETSEAMDRLISALEGLSRRNVASVSIELTTDSEEIEREIEGYVGTAQSQIIDRLVTLLDRSNNDIGISIEKSVDWDAFTTTVDLSSVELNGSVGAVDDPKYGFVEDPELRDRDNGGLPETMIKFPRDKVAESLTNGDNVSVAVTGTVSDRSFTSSDTITVKSPGKGRGNNGNSGSGQRGGNGRGK